MNLGETMPTTYEQDVIKWSEEQAQFLLAGNVAQLDLHNLAEEILDVGKAEIRELESRLEVLLAHLIKWAYQPERRGRSWEQTIKAQRIAIAKRLKRTPSLKYKLQDPDWAMWEEAWNDALALALKETGLSDFPSDMPWSEADVLTDGWFPDAVEP